MAPIELVLIAGILCAISGLPALSPKIPVFLGRRIASSLISSGAVIGLAGSLDLLSHDYQVQIIELSWHQPVGTFLFRFDHLSAFFLVVTLVISACISLYNCGYCTTSPDNRRESHLTAFFGLIVSAIIMLLVSANGITLLVFWEATALLVFLAMNLEHEQPEVRKAALYYLVASHAAVLALFLMFALLPGNAAQIFPRSGALAYSGVASTSILLTALIGFGIKAGIMPLHIWLPAAHANAPSQISAIMSGLVIKMGIYGLIRVITFFNNPPLWWGILFLSLGMISAVVGVLFAIGQHDLKRLLAYHSIENIGIIVMGIGVALIGITTHNQILFVLGMAGALLHVLNHAIFKTLLFLGAGSIIHITGTRAIDRMAGLARTLPLTSIMFLTGAAAICGLPPLNGFVSELLIYLGIFKGFGISSGREAVALALAAPALALTGGLALACFVKVYGRVFLGEPLHDLPKPHEHPAMISAMAILAGLCILIGALPFLIVRLIEPVLATIFPQPGIVLPSIQTTAHLYGLSAVAVILILLVILLVLFQVRQLKNRPATESGTWGCGYAAPSPTMQYTASSFAELLVGIFRGILQPVRHKPKISGLFPDQSSFQSHVPEVVLEKGILPLFHFIDRHLSGVRRLQSGQLNRYILFIFAALIVLLIMNYFF